MDNYNASLEVGANPPVDEFPILRWIPESMAYWKRRAKNSFKCMDDTWNEARRLADVRRQKGIKRDCIIDSLLDGEKHGDLKLNDDQLNHFLGVLVEGAADTTASAMLTSIMYLAVHPQFQEKARKELDAVCGTSRLAFWKQCETGALVNMVRLPELSDMEQVPYVNCIIKEGMRIHPV
jgi:cytochrome P450